jgi:hypothetical protein
MSSTPAAYSSSSSSSSSSNKKKRGRPSTTTAAPSHTTTKPEQPNKSKRVCCTLLHVEGPSLPYIPVPSDWRTVRLETEASSLKDCSVSKGRGLRRLLSLLSSKVPAAYAHVVLGSLIDQMMVNWPVELFGPDEKAALGKTESLQLECAQALASYPGTRIADVELHGRQVEKIPLFAPSRAHFVRIVLSPPQSSRGQVEGGRVRHGGVWCVVYRIRATGFGATRGLEQVPGRGVGARARVLGHGAPYGRGGCVGVPRWTRRTVFQRGGQRVRDVAAAVDVARCVDPYARVVCAVV